DQFQEDGTIRFVLEVQGDALLAAIERGEVCGLALKKRLETAGIVAAPWIFHLDDAGAHLGQHHRAKRTSQDAGQIDNQQTGEETIRHAHRLRKSEAELLYLSLSNNITGRSPFG